MMSLHRKQEEDRDDSGTTGVAVTDRSLNQSYQSMVVEPWGLALVGVPLMALKMPIESDRELLVPSSTGFI